jgi:hypothetical protein
VDLDRKVVEKAQNAINTSLQRVAKKLFKVFYFYFFLSFYFTIMKYFTG